MDNEYSDHIRTTALCVEFALDCVKQDMVVELQNEEGKAAEVLRRVLAKLDERRQSIERLVAEATKKAA